MNPEQQRLLEKAKRSLQAAVELNQKGFAEFAVSRGYYAMFYMATAFLEGEGLAYSKHSAVIIDCSSSFDKPVKLSNSMRIIGEIRISCKFKNSCVNHELTVISSAR
jgi:uncharacterized protein (UPF0332 family)